MYEQIGSTHTSMRRIEATASYSIGQIIPDPVTDPRWHLPTRFLAVGFYEHPSFVGPRDLPSGFYPRSDYGLPWHNTETVSAVGRSRVRSGSTVDR